MERSRSYGFFTKRSQHYDSLQQQQTAESQKQPLKDSTNTSPKTQKLISNEEGRTSNNTEPSSTQGNDPNQQSRSLQCLETLAQKAGIHDITADDCKYDVANTLLNLDRGHEFIKQSVDAGMSAAMADINKQQQQLAEATAQAVQQQQNQQQEQQQQQQQQFQQQLQQKQQQQQQHQQLVQAQSPHLQQVTVNAQGQQCIQTTTNMGPPQQAQHAQVQQQQVAQQSQQVQIQTQGGQVLAAPQSGSTTITTMSPLQQSQQAAHPQQVDWGQGRVQVIHQPTQNPMYLQQIYNPQGQLLMPGNIALHPSINPQQIQVITKPFQGNQIAAPHMITAAQGKQVIQGSQATTFPGYATIPTIPTTQNQQTLVFSQLGVISSQPNILPNHSGQGNAQVAQQKPHEMQKVMGTQKVQMQKVASSTGAVVQSQPQQGQCVQVSQAMIGTQPTAQIISPIQPGGQPMQLTNSFPWQFTANGIPQVWATNGLQSQALLTHNPIFIRGTQADGTPGMFIQQNPQTIQTQQNQAIATQATVTQTAKQNRPINENIQPKQTNRPLNILPSNATIRPASSVSTQTISAQTPTYSLQTMGNKAAPKIRQSKAPQIRSPAPKADAANQTPLKSYTNLQPHHIVGNKMVVMNTSTGMATQMTPSSPMTPDKLANQQNKQQQNQPVNVNQQLAEVVMQQQVLKKEAMQLQQTIQQTLQQFQIHQNQQSQQQIQAKPMMTLQAIQGIPQQQIQMGGDRSLIPVQQVQQQLQQQIPCSIQQGIPLQPNLVTQAMNMQQIHPQQLAQMASQGTILTGQLQQQGGTHTVVPQVVNQNGHQMPQLQHITVSAASHQHPTHQTQQLQPQLVPLPPIVPAVTEKDNGVSLLQEALSPGQTMPVTTTAALLKESGSSDGNSVETKESLAGQDSKQCSIGVDAVASLHIPNAGTVPNQPTTSELSIPIATTAEEVKERCPPKAMVKPQVSKVLTHVIEDFVIQESSEPFPVSRSGMVGDLKRPHSTNDQDDDILRKKRSMSPSNLSPRGDMAKCESCGVVDLKSKFKKNKRFCSVACSKSGKSKDDKKKSEKLEPMNADNSKAESTSRCGADVDNTPKVDPLKWGVQEVFDFIRNLPGCSDYAEDFLIQEIDGQALLLLKEDHLMTAMSMKLGPALKIVAKIDDMRIDKEPPPKPL